MTEDSGLSDLLANIRDKDAEIARLKAALYPCLGWLEYAYNNVDSVTSAAVKTHLPAIRDALTRKEE